MSETREPKKKISKGAGGLFIPAGLFIGMGIGFATGNLVPWLFVGLGGGLLLFAIIMIAVRE
jgi:hypothetical protein